MKTNKFMAFALATLTVLTACGPKEPTPDPNIKSKLPEVAATEGAYTVVWNAVDYAECNDLVFAGNYNNYKTEDVANMVKFEKIEGYTNWYKAVITPSEANPIEQLEGKPCALAADGTFPSGWDHQWIGSKEKPCEILKGEVDFEVEYETETKMIVKQIGSVVYVRSYQFKVDPCIEEPEYDITFNLTVAQAMPDTAKVYVVGDFVENGWVLDAYEMTRVDDTHFTATVKAKIGRGYKYAANASWDYEMVPNAPEEGKDCSEKLKGNLTIADVTMNDDVYGFNNINATICKEEAQEGVMYIRCAAEEWSWKEMTKDAEKEIYTFSTTLTDISNVGANINSIAGDTGAAWFPLEAGELAVGDKVVYTYDATLETPTLVIAKSAE